MNICEYIHLRYVVEVVLDLLRDVELRADFAGIRSRSAVAEVFVEDF